MASRAYSFDLPIVPSCSSIRPAARCSVSPSGSFLVIRLARRSSMSCLARLIVPVSFARLAWSSRQAVRILSFRSAARRAFRVLRLPPHPFRFRLSCSLRLMAMGTGGGSSCPCLVVACLFPCLSSVIVGWGDGGMGVPFDNTRDAPFSSARFLHQCGDEMTMMILIRPPQGAKNATRRYGAI